MHHTFTRRPYRREPDLVRVINWVSGTRGGTREVKCCHRQRDTSQEIGTEDLAPNLEAKIKAITHYPDIRRSARETQELVQYGIKDQAMVAADESDLLDKFRSYKEAGGRPDHQKWRKAMEEEIQTFNQKTV